MKYPRYGCNTLYYLLRNDGVMANHKRVERLYRLEGLSLRLKKRKRRYRLEREVLSICRQPDEIWSMDFIHDWTLSDRRLKCLTIIDHFSKEAPHIEANYSIRSEDVVTELDRLKNLGRKPKTIVVDNGPEFRSKNLLIWCKENNVHLSFIQPGKPTQNAFIESFNNIFRQLCLSANYFTTLPEAKLIIESWRKEYNSHRPHGSLNGRTPLQVAKEFGIVTA